MADLSPWRQDDALAGTDPHLCPRAHEWAHADIAESLNMPRGTLLRDDGGRYCPACDYRPERDRQTARR